MYVEAAHFVHSFLLRSFSLLFIVLRLVSRVLAIFSSQICSAPKLSQALFQKKVSSAFKASTWQAACDTKKTSYSLGHHICKSGHKSVYGITPFSFQLTHTFIDLSVSHSKCHRSRQLRKLLLLQDENVESSTAAGSYCWWYIYSFLEYYYVQGY